MKVRDWVLNPQTYQGLDAVSQEYSYQVLEPGELWVAPLTYHQAGSAALEAVVPELTSRMLALETRGYIHCHIEPAAAGNTWDAQVWGLSWRAMALTRITRYPLETRGNSVSLIDDYFLSDIPAANDNYVWHREQHLVNTASSEWQGTAGARARLSWTWPVVARYKRTLEELDCMAAMVQFEQGDTGPGLWEDIQGTVRLRFNVRLRTFVVTEG